MAALVLLLYSVLVPIAQVVFLISLLVLVPMAFIAKTRRFAGDGLFFGSYLFALVTWLLGALVSLGAYGWVGLVIGLIFLGVGVVPMGIFAAFFSLHEVGLGITLIVMTAITWAARIGGSYVRVKAIEEEFNIISHE